MTKVTGSAGGLKPDDLPPEKTWPGADRGKSPGIGASRGTCRRAEPLVHRFRNCLGRPQGMVARHIEMGAGPQALGPGGVDEHPLLGEFCRQLPRGSTGGIHLEKDEVGFDFSGVDVDSRNLLNPRSEQLGVVVVLPQAVDVVIERVQGGRRDNTGLPQGSAKQFANPPSLGNVFAGPDEDGAHRTPQPLRETDRDRVDLPAEVTRRVASGHHRIEHAGTVEVDLQSMRVGPITDSLDLGQRINPAPSHIRGVLQADEAGPAEMLVVGPDLPIEVGNIQQAILAREEPTSHPAEGSRSSLLVVRNVTGVVDQHLISGETVHPDPHLVRLCPRTGEHCSLFPEQLADPLFEAVDGGIFGQHVVANLGFGHGTAHSSSGLGGGITPQINSGRHLDAGNLGPGRGGISAIYRQRVPIGNPPASLPRAEAMLYPEGTALRPSRRRPFVPVLLIFPMNPSGASLNIPTIDCRKQDARQLIDSLRGKLGIRGDIVSESGRQRTLELFGEALSPQQVVERICGDVRSRGLQAVLDYGARLDRKTLSAAELRVSPAEFRAARQQARPEYLRVIERVAANIGEFQTAILPRDVELKKSTPGGGTIALGQRYRPMRRIGICVPGGAAAYPSTLLMTAVPAQVAGVREIAVMVPPTPFGGFNADLLAACDLLGIHEVYRTGGAQGVAALAYGTEGTPRVDKIVGPGNLFVALAKRWVFGEVDIDSIAGPSEVVVLADDSAHPEFVASDLISQAEHSPGSGVLITWHAALIEQVRQALERQLEVVDRGDLARSSLEEYGALILARDEAEATGLTDLFAPEHLHISTREPRKTVENVQNAGAIFLGHHTPVALGDYVAGPSHVLPTGGTARFANGLCATDFLKRSSLIAYDQAALQHTADDVRLLAQTEGLTAHAASVDIRLTTGHA